MVPKEMNVEMNTISSEMEHCGGLILRCFEKNVTKKHLWSLYRTLTVLVIFVLLLAIWLRSLRWIKKKVMFHFHFSWC